MAEMEKRLMTGEGTLEQESDCYTSVFLKY